MSESQPTLRDALATPGPNAKPGDPDPWLRFQQQINAQVKGIKWVATMPDVGAMLGELFDIPIPGLLLGSWRKADEVLRALRESEQSPDEVRYIELKDHQIDRELHPYIEVRIENVQARKLEFTVRLSFRLKGFVLKIQAGRVKEIRSAQCEFGGTVEFLNRPVLTKDFTPIKLPGSIPISEDAHHDDKSPVTRRS